ncbi:unnamed protein product, partial [Angiostrongylus costaricensis]|uniref:Mab-21 domain-containing protein n=1 Tax=Angiostrongylus costaricensis TaxID=334426 RepID=A0A0R3PEN1_ANGCS
SCFLHIYEDICSTFYEVDCQAYFKIFFTCLDAPLHSINSNIRPSSGVCTFPPDSLFPDRFILRAIGQKLYLEERSLCRTVVNNTLCLDFSRTAILPGTSVALFEQGILCIVVPTQSTVHRFFAKLVFDPAEMTAKEVIFIVNGEVVLQRCERFTKSKCCFNLHLVVVFLAARAQYEYAFVLRTQTEQTPEILRRRRDALAVASMLLDLLPKEDRFLSFPQEVCFFFTILWILKYYRRYTGLNFRLIEEWIIANARVALLETGKVPPCEPKEIVENLISIKSYDVAFDVCRLNVVFGITTHCNVSMCDLLYAVTRESIMVDADQPNVPPSWVQVNQRHSEKVSQAEEKNHWSIVRGMMACVQRLWPADCRPLRAITRAFLSHNLPVPCWLDAEYARDIGGYLRCLIDYGAFSHAIKLATNSVDEETKKVCFVFHIY